MLFELRDIEEKRERESIFTCDTPRIFICNDVVASEIMKTQCFDVQETEQGLYTARTVRTLANKKARAIH